MYTSKERVIRDGYLIAFEGEVMSDEEAKARGLVSDEKPKPKRSRKKPATTEEPAPSDEPATTEEPEQ